MKPRSITLAFLAGALAGCMASGPPITAQAPAPEPRSPAGSPSSGRHPGVDAIGTPLILDRTDFSIGTTVHFSRIPTASELYDATQIQGFSRLVLSLPFWPVDMGQMQALEAVAEEAQIIVVLPGYPPNHAASDAWNRLKAPLRIVVVVPGPPLSQAVLDDLNTMRGLERVIAQMDEPTRYGFERLQRPLSFRKIVD